MKKHSNFKLGAPPLVPLLGREPTPRRSGAEANYAVLRSLSISEGYAVVPSLKVAT